MSNAFGLRQISLVALTVQNTALAIVMRLSAQEGKNIRTLVVLMDEFVKVIVCTCILFFIFYRGWKHQSEYIPIDTTSARHHSPGLLIEWVTFYELEVFGSVKDFLMMGIPAVCYTIQKNLMLIAISDLSPAVFQILFQGKILTTAFMSYMVLNKVFTKRQKLAMGILFVGCCLVQLSSIDEESSVDTQKGSSLRGFIAITVACFTSAFSAVFLEKAIKGKGAEEKSHTIWVRNIQLSIFGCIASMIAARLEDKEQIDKQGFLDCFTPIVWITVLTSSVGGLLVSLVMKYADNIYKTLATSVAIVLVSVLSIMFFGLSLSFSFVLGAFLTLFSVHLYSSNPSTTTEDNSSVVVVPTNK